jgi:hypothetical protein
MVQATDGWEATRLDDGIPGYSGVALELVRFAAASFARRYVPHILSELIAPAAALTHLSTFPFSFFGALICGLQCVGEQGQPTRTACCPRGSASRTFWGG